MAAQKFNIMQISENYVIFFLGVAVAFVGYLLARTMGTFDKRLDNHDERITKQDQRMTDHEKQMSEYAALQKSNEVQLVNINSNLESIFSKIAELDNSIKHIYDKYDLQIKK